MLARQFDGCGPELFRQRRPARMAASPLCQPASQLQLSDPGQHRPACCPQCQAKDPLTAHGFYCRTIIDAAFDGEIRVGAICARSAAARYRCCRSSHYPTSGPASLAVIAWWLLVHLLPSSPPPAPAPPAMPYQRGQFWLRRFRAQAAAVCVALSSLTTPAPAPNFIERALGMLTTAGWTPAHRFLFADLRQHLLGWPRALAPHGRRLTLPPAAAPA